MNKIKLLISKLEDQGYWEAITYIFFGGLTTVVNFVVYFLFKDLGGFSLIVSNTISWVVSVIFAFITNKKWVFKSTTHGIKLWMIEFSQFVFYRILSFGIDMSSMLFLIKGLRINDFIAKFITQLLIVVANYIFSKLFIFKKKEI